MNIKNNSFNAYQPILFVFFLASIFPFSVSAQDKINMQSMEKDITFLSSDKLKGRSVFSKEIDIAANYIAERFRDIGLTPLDKKGFIQSFIAHKISNDTLSVEINAKKFNKNKTAIMSNQVDVIWQQDSNINITYIKKRDDLFNTIDRLNIEGGNHLVLVHSEHKILFNRYKKYFEQGNTRLSIEEPASIVLVLSRISEVNELIINAKNTIISQPLSNVVGILPGKGKPEEFVIFSAHYDHLGEDHLAHAAYEDLNMQDNTDKDTIFNGADDDASGTTAVIQLAETFSKQAKYIQNERTIIFSAFTAEEVGGYGSQYFSKKIIADNVKAMINIEMIGKPSKFGSGTFWMTGFERSDLALLMNRTLKSHQEESDDLPQVFADPYPEQNLFYRSDNATLARLGVPAHSFSSTQLDKDPHYHQVSDELSTLELPSMAHVINLIAQASKGLINGTQTPKRLDTSTVQPRGKIF